MLCRREVTAARDISTPLLAKPRSSSRRATARKRALTASRLMSTTVNLLQPLHIHEVLRSPRGQFERNEAFTRNHTHAPTFNFRALPIVPRAIERTVHQQRIEHERLALGREAQIPIANVIGRCLTPSTVQW